jgi:hypothetical protein
MDGISVVSAIFVLILAYLIINNASNFNTAMNGASSGLTNVIGTLQGR